MRNKNQKPNERRSTGKKVMKMISWNVSGLRSRVEMKMMDGVIDGKKNYNLDKLRSIQRYMVKNGTSPVKSEYATVCSGRTP